MTSRDPNSAFVTRTRGPDTWAGKRNANASMNPCEARHARFPSDQRHDRASPPDQDGPFLVRGRRRRNGEQPLRNLLTSYVRGTA